MEIAQPERYWTVARWASTLMLVRARWLTAALPWSMEQKRLSHRMSCCRAGRHGSMVCCGAVVITDYPKWESCSRRTVAVKFRGNLAWLRRRDSLRRGSRRRGTLVIAVLVVGSCVDLSSSQCHCPAGRRLLAHPQVALRVESKSTESRGGRVCSREKYVDGEKIPEGESEEMRI